MPVVVPSPEIVSRARELLAGKSRGYVDDAYTLARVVVAIADGVEIKSVIRAPISPIAPSVPPDPDRP